MGGRRWTWNELRTLRGCVRDGMFAEEIAEQLPDDRTPTAVRKMSQYLRLRHPARGKGTIDAAARSRLLKLLTDVPELTMTCAAVLMRRRPQNVSAMARRLTRDGLLRREGTHTTSVRYVVVHAWTCAGRLDRMT